MSITSHLLDNCFKVWWPRLNFMKQKIDMPALLYQRKKAKGHCLMKTMTELEKLTFNHHQRTTKILLLEIYATFKNCSEGLNTIWSIRRKIIPENSEYFWKSRSKTLQYYKSFYASSPIITLHCPLQFTSRYINHFNFTSF